MPLSIAVVSAGLHGLSTALILHKHGHEVTLWLGPEEGLRPDAGIEIPPNSSRVLKHYGLLDKLAPWASKLECLHFKDYSTGAELEEIMFTTQHGDVYDAPYLVIRRSLYFRLLLLASERCGLTIKTCRESNAMNEDIPSLTLDEKEEQYDLIVGDDGWRSWVRNRAFPEVREVVEQSTICVSFFSTPRAAKSMEASSPEFLTPGNFAYWIGPGSHVLAFPISNGEFYHLELVWDEAVAPRVSYDFQGLMNHLQNFDPSLKHALMLPNKVQSFRQHYGRFYSNWCSKSGKVALIGSSARPMTSFMSQEFAMATEDAAVLAKCLDTVNDSTTVVDAVRVYQKLRRPRVEHVTAGMKNTVQQFHLPYGEEQQMRDESVGGYAWGGNMSLVHSERFHVFPKASSNVLNADFQRWLFGFDATAEPSHATTVSNRR